MLNLRIFSREWTVLNCRFRFDSLKCLIRTLASIFFSLFSLSLTSQSKFIISKLYSGGFSQYCQLTSYLFFSQLVGLNREKKKWLVRYGREMRTTSKFDMYVLCVLSCLTFTCHTRLVLHQEREELAPVAVHNAMRLSASNIRHFPPQATNAITFSGFSVSKSESWPHKWSRHKNVGVGGVAPLQGKLKF